MTSPFAGKRLRFTPLALTTVLLSAGLLSMSVTGTLSGFAAQITNSANSATTGTLVMQETGLGSNGTPVTCLSTDSGSVSTNSATCTTINKFGGPTTMVPGSKVVTSVTFKNTGTAAASGFTLLPGPSCTQTNVGATNGSATDLCAKMALTVTQDGGAAFFDGNLKTFAASGLTTLTKVAAGGTSTFVFTVTLDQNADNTYQGLQASVPMTWTFTS